MLARYMRIEQVLLSALHIRPYHLDQPAEKLLSGCKPCAPDVTRFKVLPPKLWWPWPSSLLLGATRREHLAANEL